MRIFILVLIITCTILLSVACGSSEQSGSSTGSAEATPTATVRTPAQSTAQPAATPSDAPPVAIAHGAPPPGQTVPPAGNNAPPMSSSGASGMDTAALDKKVEQAEKKAKTPKATQADKMAAAAAYLERANVFYKAGNPSLYKFALRDFRRTLRYDPSNEEARAKQQQIIEIYQSMGRPVPDLGNEQ